MENTRSEEALPTEMTPDEALGYATRLHRIGELDAAETLYRRILALLPDHPAALNFLAIARHQRGHAEEAIALMQRSLALQPEAAGVWNNLGNILLDLGRIDEASEAYQRCTALAPQDPLPFGNLGVLRRAQGRLEEAEAAYRHALTLDPKNVDVHNNLGNLLAGMERVEEAVQHYCQTIALMPRHPAARKMLGYAYCMLGRLEEAAAYYRAWVEEEPDNPTARHHLAACTGEDVPERATDIYVESVFDNFADSFDAKLAALTYKAPELVAKAVAAACGEGKRGLAVLDAGCGTGWCGPLLAPYARELTGIDLSGPMLTKAQGRGAYDRLVKAELTRFLQDAAPGSYDLVVSADTLCYFGALETVCAAAAAALGVGGHLVFTVEKMAAAADAAGYRLEPSGRYTHAPGYVSRALQAAGFTSPLVEEAVLRTEGGKPVTGLLYSARKAATSR